MKSSEIRLTRLARMADSAWVTNFLERKLTTELPAIGWAMLPYANDLGVRTAERTDYCSPLTAIFVHELNDEAESTLCLSTCLA